MIALFFLLALQGVGDDPPWNQYRPSTFREILSGVEAMGEEACRDARPEKDCYVIDAVPGRHRVVAVFTGERRPLSAAHAKVIDAWGRSTRNPRFSAEIVGEEVRVREGAASYWVALQRGLAAHFHEDVRAGDPVELFLACLGAMNRDWFFIVNAFDQVGPPPGSAAADGGAGDEKPAP